MCTYLLLVGFVVYSSTTPCPYQVLKSLEANPLRCQRIAADAQQFAYTFLSQYGKAMYVRKALWYYNSLVTDMQAFMTAMQWPVPTVVAATGGSGAEALDREGEEAEAGARDLTLHELMEQMRSFIGQP